MNKLFLMKNPDLFQGEKYLNKNKAYFEGWYFKNTNKENVISFIPGINTDNKGKKAFIQVITNNSSHFIDYGIDDFHFSSNPFHINIGNSTFSKDGVHIDIKQDNLNIYGDIKYSNSTNIKTNIFTPNIMGPFSYMPYMECNHAILSMQNKANGAIYINDRKIPFDNDVGYIEKDWGSSFPKSYVWCQGNNFEKSNASFMLSVADIPFKLFSFTGIICVLLIDDKEYKFTTYNTTKLIEYDVTDNLLNITLKKDNYYLTVNSKYDAGHKLSAPVKGRMEKDIFESVSASINLTLRKNNNVIFSETSSNCGLEIVL